MLICLITLPFFLLLLFVVSFLIKIEDKGPIIFKSYRIGKDGKMFIMYKFRSMKVNSPNWLNKDGSTFNAKDDPRVTKIGKIIRSLSIDEVPQILNVLKGEMSIIGPRASLSDALKSYKNYEIDKMKVRPGITGYTQAYYRNELSNREKRKKDAWYANNVSFILDTKILFKTITTVFSRKGLYTCVK